MSGNPRRHPRPRVPALCFSFLILLAEQVGVGASIQQNEDKFLVLDFPDEQPVGLDVTFPLSFAVACQYMGMVLLFEQLAVE